MSNTEAPDLTKAAQLLLRWISRKVISQGPFYEFRVPFKPLWLDADGSKTWTKSASAVMLSPAQVRSAANDLAQSGLLLIQKARGRTHYLLNTPDSIEGRKMLWRDLEAANDAVDLLARHGVPAHRVAGDVVVSSYRLLTFLQSIEVRQ